MRYIYVSSEFMEELTSFITRHADKIDHLYMKVIKKIKEFFVYSIKTGVRNPLVKGNGETFVRISKVYHSFPKEKSA